MSNTHTMNTRSKDNTITLKKYINDDSSDSGEEEEEISPYNKKRKRFHDSLLDYLTELANEKKNNIGIKLTDEEFENILKESDEELDDELDELDEYDNQYDELTNLIDINDEDEIHFEYFKKLEIYNKISLLKDIKTINDINNNNIPLKFKILHSDMDINTKSIALKQIEKISEMDSSSGEYAKIDQWISGLIKIPFNRYIYLPVNDNSSIIDKRNFLKNTNDILNKAIYGHYEAKSHILQVLGKWIKNPESSGNVLALQGPMGNGKTTLVKEGIAKAIGRPFAFIALGGASDSSYFDGHNFTYEGSRWGRIIDILIQSKCMNPIIYFDELDKVSGTYKGQEIIHLLTHLTDHSQNDRYQDNYFTGINIDLSKALFIFSFNNENNIDPILKDRMYVINTHGFNVKDKIEIAKNYLLPELLDTFKYNNSIIFTDDVLKHIIETYTENEKGVRNLKRCLETIISKVNMYELLYDSVTMKSEINLPYKLDEFTIPYVVNEIELREILNKKNDGGPPINMYL